ncbi:hypothetical protein RJT34_10943 [Clitoria ternatea]|uniref:Uncharacterized protein n=1 Tax=Clitoria ternatea TaxID=43366 RepID=A0AAN9PJK6_CLITE
MAAMDRNEVTIEIERMLSKAEPPFTAECCIYRVPLLIRNVNLQAYTPRLEFVELILVDCGFIIELLMEYSIPNRTDNVNLSPSTIVSIVHFTDLLRMFHLQPDNRQPSRQPIQIMHLNSATELIEAGVKFRVNKKSNCLLDLELSGRYLQIPEFTVHDWTEIVFRNMVALEQCHYPYTSYITDYMAILDFLINTGKDVDVLIQNGIITNWIGDSDAVAKLYNGLGKNITLVNSNSVYLDIYKRLNEYCKRPWNKWKATLRRDYCKTPWQIAASAAATLLLILTIIQTLCSILQAV